STLARARAAASPVSPQTWKEERLRPRTRTCGRTSRSIRRLRLDVVTMRLSCSFGLLWIVGSPPPILPAADPHYIRRLPLLPAARGGRLGMSATARPHFHGPALQQLVAPGPVFSLLLRVEAVVIAQRGIDQRDPGRMRHAARPGQLRSQGLPVEGEELALGLIRFSGHPRPPLLDVL